jgi:hypothetical protein
MSDANVVGVNNQESCIPGESELFREGFVADLRGRFEKRARKKDEEKDQEVVSIHWLAFRIPRAPLV